MLSMNRLYIAVCNNRHAKAKQSLSLLALLIGMMFLRTVHAQSSQSPTKPPTPLLLRTRVARSLQWQQSPRQTPCQLIDSVSGEERRHVVLTTVSGGYMDVFFNWLLFFTHTCHTLTNLHVLCLDSACKKALDDRQMKCITPPPDAMKTLSSVWTYRAELISRYINMGLDVIQSDVDALWLQDPFPWFSFNASIVGSR